MAGRVFNRGDTGNAPLLVVINQEAARRFWPGESPVGKRINFDQDPQEPWATIIGVVADLRYRDLACSVGDGF